MAESFELFTISASIANWQQAELERRSQMFSKLIISADERNLIETNINTVGGIWTLYLHSHLTPMAPMVSTTNPRRPYMSHFTGFDGYGADLMDQLSCCMCAMGALFAESVVKKNGLATYGFPWSSGDPNYETWIRRDVRDMLSFICRVGGLRYPKQQMLSDMADQLESWMVHAQDFSPMDVSEWRTGKRSVEMQRDVSRMVELWSRSCKNLGRAQTIRSDLDKYWSKFNEIRLAKFERMLDVMRMETHVQGGAQ